MEVSIPQNGINPEGVSALARAFSKNAGLQVRPQCPCRKQFTPSLATPSSVIKVWCQTSIDIVIMVKVANIKSTNAVAAISCYH